MAKSNPIIKAALEKARVDFLEYNVQQQRKIYELFDQTSKSIIEKLNKYIVAGKIPPTRLKYLLIQISEEMKYLRPKLKGVITASQQSAIDFGLKMSIIGADAVTPNTLKAGIGTSFIGKDGIVRKYDAKEEAYSASMWARINKEAMDALIKTAYGGITLSRRVWDVTWPVERQIRNKINYSVLTGTSANGLARQIRSYLGLPKSFSSIVSEALHPGSGVYRSAYQNARRLAVTEINRAFHEGVLRYGKNKTWVSGYIWRTASGNPCEECESNEGQFFPKDEPPDIPLHPWCFCYAEITYEPDE